MIASPCVSRPGKKNGNSPRVRKRQKPIALTVPGQQIAKPIVWPAELTRQKPARRKISIPQTAFEQLPPLPDAARGWEAPAHILPVSIPQRPADSSAASVLAQQELLRHKQCLVYQEVSHFLYSETTFTFAGFGELDAFLDWISPETALSIRSVTFIAHMLPNGTEHCKELIGGNYFRGAGRDHVALFRRMPNLRKLDIHFFPSAMLAFTTQFVDMMKPLEELPRTVAIGVVLPRVYYKQDRSGDGLPFVGRFGAGASFYSVARPVIFAGVVATSCEAYRKFF
ncbi:hypothetical protein MYCTH_103134 [Thermothelomyces thermophilus ATCC 42464]|uniref:Uncharacterized protein n=1 Tax=Thermothelomyces thermophilus (strain ATCC 42464 / BCRC 31852 / DSM 1799) TaxID=573729 RepID=G2QIF9_THET4|nr:uncharacterized protein MYCTH_103134 [Thermothelomyces thermophilus ATCC 42464]AEO60333.1 hypothetical protein MYCTH_103134 [Thermothelomyces thermophilus ATCC 42464]